MASGITRKYLDDLAVELRARGVRPARIIEETGAHLEDIAQGLCREGVPAGDAERQALERFGSARAVAARFASQHFGLDSLMVLAASLAAGAAIAWMDNRPHWDDSGITAFAMLVAGGLMGLVVPRRPWLWALAIWVALPAWNIAKSGGFTPGMLAWTIVLLFPLAGALIGTLVRRTLARA